MRTWRWGPQFHNVLDFAKRKGVHDVDVDLIGMIAQLVSSVLSRKCPKCLWPASFNVILMNFLFLESRTFLLRNSI